MSQTSSDHVRLEAFLRRLLELSIDAGAAPETLDSLWLARGALAKAVYSDRPIRHLAVLGPTQSGKSSVVNLLLGGRHASVSPLAGHTRHSQAFGVDCDPARAIESWFPAARIVAPNELDPEQTDQVGACVTPAGGSSVETGTCVWDTPDFDSVTAEAYRSSVLATAGTADAHLVVVSREKYADQSVWRLLELLAPLGRPTLIVLNKTSPDAEEPLLSAIRARLSDLPDDHRPSLTALPYTPGGLEQASVASGQKVAERVRELLMADAPDGISSMLARYWGAWTAAARAEHVGVQTWRREVKAGIEQVIEDYRRDYINHPERFAEFRLAVLELLDMLEIPAVAKVMGQARHWMTWPARQIGKLWQSTKSGGARGGDEELVLRGAADALLVRLKRLVAEHDAATAWAGALSTRLGERDAALLDHFKQASMAHREAFAAEIHAAARSLRERLAEQPLLLNTLRTARATADAAAIGIAIKTGGLAPTGALLAPVLMSVTEHLTRGALGAYTSQVSTSLKVKQLDAVRRNVVEATLRTALLEMTDDLRGRGVWGVAPEELAEIDALVGHEADRGGGRT